jgi:hypothetical protein
MEQPRYVSVDDLQAQTTLQEAAAKCGVEIEVHGSGRQVRLDCPFGCYRGVSSTSTVIYDT